MKRSVFVGVAALLPLLVPATGFGATVLYDTTGASVTCSSVVGSIKIKPALNFVAAATTTDFKMKATLGGCVSSGALPSEPTIVSGKLKGTLTLAAGANCLALAATTPVTGNLEVKWKTASGQKLDFGSTIFTPGAVSGSSGTVAYTPVLPAGPVVSPVGVYAAISSGGTLVASSAFAAGVPAFFSLVGEDTLSLTPLCGLPVPKGIKKISLGLGELTL